jgi:hypothetical protein
LDNHEGGVQRAHHPKEVLVHPHGDKEQKVMVMTYALFRAASEHQPPGRDYMDCMLRGARQRGFPANYIAQLERFKVS